MADEGAGLRQSFAGFRGAVIRCGLGRRGMLADEGLEGMLKGGAASTQVLLLDFFKMVK